MLKDFEIGLPSKLPSKKDDLFNFSFNFENLIKTIDYLHKYNLALFSKLQNFNERMINFEKIAAEFPKVKEEIQNLQLYSKEHEKLIKENEKKIGENENKIDDLAKKIDQNKTNIATNEELIENNKKNIDILLKDKNDRETKENEENEEIEENEENDEIANENKNEDKIPKGKYQIQNNNNIIISNNRKKSVAKIPKNFNVDIIKGEYDNDIELLKHNINNINEKLKEMQINIDSTNNQMQRNISNLINSIENNGQTSFQLNVSGKNTDANLFKMAMTQIEKNKKYVQDMMDQFSSGQEKLKHDVNWLNSDLSETKTNYQNLLKLFEEYQEDKRYYLTYKDIKDISKNVDILLSKIKEFSPKSDLESTKTDINIQFQKITAKLKDLDELKREKNAQKGHGEWDPEDLNFVPVTKRISQLVSDLLKSEGKNIDLTKNKHFIELMKLNQHNSTEIDKNLKNFLDLKTIISSNLENNDIDQIKKEIEEFKKELKANRSKLNGVIQLIGGFDFSITSEKDLREKYEEEELFFNNKLRQSEETIKGKIDFLTEYVEDLSNKLMKAEKKVNSISKDLKDDMKANLRLDTYKVVEQFKLKLNSFTDKFENELKNKIDKIGLNVFENKMNSKLNMDLKDKISKNDLKKNNFMVNKKFDTLENKISKTLVDTIIDLQMDDAPLLLKKNQRNFELCASCNRPLNENNICSKTIEQMPNPTSPNYTKTPRIKIKNVASLKKLPVISSPPK